MNEINALHELAALSKAKRNGMSKKFIFCRSDLYHIIGGERVYDYSFYYIREFYGYMPSTYAIGVELGKNLENTLPQKQIPTLPFISDDRVRGEAVSYRSKKTYTITGIIRKLSGDPMTEITFQSRLRELTNTINPKVLDSEVEALNGDLQALEALARPRLAAEWLAAGGSRSAFTDVTDEQIEDARKWRSINFIELNKNRHRFYCSPL